MPTLTQLLAQLQSYVWSLTQQNSSKKLVTAMAVLIGMLWMYRRVEQARMRERRVLRDAHGNILPANIALNQHAPSPLPPAHSSSSSSASSSAASSNDTVNDVRKLSPEDRYLSERGSRVRRQTVCLTLARNNGVVFDEMTSPTATLSVQDSIVPLLLSLARNTTLHCVIVEADKTRQAEILTALSSIGLLDSGLKKHRVLFCSAPKSKSAIIRHIEPNLCIDDDRAMLLALKPHLDQVVHIDPKTDAVAPSSASATAAAADINSVPSFPSLWHFFLPQQ